MWFCLSLAIYSPRMVIIVSLCWNMLTAGCIFGKIITRQYLWYKNVHTLQLWSAVLYEISVRELEKLYWQSAKWEGQTVHQQSVPMTPTLQDSAKILQDNNTMIHSKISLAINTKRPWKGEKDFHLYSPKFDTDEQKVHGANRALA